MSGAEKAFLLGGEMEANRARLADTLARAAELVAEIEIANARLAETMGESRPIDAVEEICGEMRAAVGRAASFNTQLPFHLGNLREMGRRMCA